MKTFITIFSFVLLFSFQNLYSQIATDVVISEFATRGASSAYDEFVELYNPMIYDIDISKWKLQYKSANGSSWQDLVAIPQSSVIKAHGYYLISNNQYSGTILSDLKWGANGIADNGHIRIIDASASEIDKVGYGTAIDPKGSPSPNHGTTGNNNSVERKASLSSTAASLTIGGAEEKAGNGYNSNNNANDFVVQTNGRNPQNSTSPIEPKSADGMGTAYGVQKTVYASTTIDLDFIFKPSLSDPVSEMKIIIPSEFKWTRSTWDVVYDPNMTAIFLIKDDSILFNSVSITGDSVQIKIKSLTTPSITGTSTFRFFTKSISHLAEIQSSPTILVLGTPISIFDARENDVNGVPKKLGQYVTTNGVVTVANEFGGPSFMQDASGGIAVFDQNFSSSVSIGDEVMITGKIDQYNGLTEITDVKINAKPSSGNIIAPKVVHISDLVYDGTNGIEQYESMLVRINGVSVNTNIWTVNGPGSNYRINVGSDQLDLRVDNNVDFVGQPAPAGLFDVVGVIGQFKSSSPYIGAYQLMPRSHADIISSGPRIVTYPIEKNIQSNSVSIQWTTQQASSSFVRLGKTKSYELGIRGQTDSLFAHIVSLSSLEPATIYQAQAFSIANGDTSFAPDLVFITASKTSTGKMNVYFSKSVDTKLAVDEQAQGDVNLSTKLLARISSAKYSIDACLYSLSGNVGNDIASALLDAKNRGVEIRMIVENDNANTSPMNTLRNAIPFITDAFDPINAGAGLMHNKFFIIDGHDRSSDLDDWVITGSWNPTDEGTLNDSQNYIEIQDQALAVSYTAGFEEMWGSSTNAADKNNSRFGARKMDVTPHRLNINNIPCELYFSPGDRTTNKIIDALSSAASSINFSVMTVTRSDISNVLVSKKSSAITVHGLMDNNTDTGTQFGFLQTNGIDMHIKPSSFNGMYHHKYAIIDAEKYDATSTVITGSHNWTTSAETSNNENTLIIHNARIANLYLQEFGKRYTDAGGTDKIISDVQNDNRTLPSDIYLGQNYPNPFSTVTNVDFRLTNFNKENASLKVYDVLGREVIDLSNQIRNNDTYKNTIIIEGNLLPRSGIYFCRFATSAGTSVIKLNFLK